MEIYADDELIKTYQGEPSDQTRQYLRLNVKSCSSIKNFLWVSGKNSISIINLKNLKETKINDFFTHSVRFNDEIGSPIAFARMQKPDIVIGLIEFKNGEFCLNCIYIIEKYQEWLDIKDFFSESNKNFS